MNKTNEPCAAVVLIRAQGEQMRRKLEEYEVKKDCFGYRSGFKCSALKQMYCSVEHCRFYKTKGQFERDREKYPFVGTGE